jgi:putative oxidoreductase
MKTLIDGLIGWPERVAKHPAGWAPLFARIVVGWVFLWSGWGKLHNLPAIIDNFAGWHIPAPHILAPFVSGVEFFGGLFLLLGLLTRISAGALGVTMFLSGVQHEKVPILPVAPSFLLFATGVHRCRISGGIAGCTT